MCLLTISVATSQNGWTDDFIGAEWFEKSFIPQATAQSTSGKPILLVLDGHGSHETSEIIRLAEANNIIILCLPPHTTHKLQPLDVGVFGPFQRAWLDRCDDIAELTGSEMPKENFIMEYMQVRQATFRLPTIVSAFKKSGLWPIDRTVFSDDDFAPSIPYSTQAQDFPQAPEIVQLLPLDADESDMDSDTDSDSDDESDSELQELRGASCSHPTVEVVHPPTASLPTSAPGPYPMPMEPHSSPNDTPPPRSEVSPIPPNRFYHDPVLFARISQLESNMATLQGHVKMVELELQNEKRKNNERANKPSKRRKLNVEARVLTSAEGKRLAVEKDAERKVKEQKKKDAAARRKQKENDREQQRRARAPNTPFTGSLSSKSKPDLQEIVGVLSLPEDGTKEVLVRRINTFFDSHPRLRDSDRFTGLFNRASKRRADTNDAAQTQTFNNPPPIPLAPQASGSASQLPLTTNIANFPVAGPSISHNFTFPPAPLNHHHFGFCPTDML